MKDNTTSKSNMNELQLNASFDRDIIWHRGGSTRYLLAEVTAPKNDQPEHERPPVNLGIAIDISGSMGGPPLDCAKRAAIGIVDSLRDGDRLSIAVFDSSADLIFPGEVLDDNTRTVARREIERLEVRGCTNLEAGWLEACESVAVGMEFMPQSMHRVIVLSDGMANRGECNPLTLGTIAEGLCERGVYTSSIGIGDHYSPTQLQAISDGGGGRMHDAQHPEEIIQVVAAELGEILTTVAENVTVTLDGPDTFVVEPFGTYPVRQNGRKIDVSLGSLLPRGSRALAVKFVGPATAIGEEHAIRVSVSWTEPNSSQRHTSEATTCVLTSQRGVVNSAQPRRVGLSVMVAQKWLSHIVHYATRLNGEGECQRAAQYVRHQCRFFGKYCDDLPGCEDLQFELERLQSTISQQWSPRACKEVLLHSNKTMRGEHDRRHQSRKHYADFMGE